MFKKLLIGLSLFATSCGDNQTKWKKEITEFKTTTKDNIKSFEQRLKDCKNITDELYVTKVNFKVSDYEKSWIDPLEKYVALDKVSGEDYKKWNSTKNDIAKRMESLDKGLKKTNC